MIKFGRKVKTRRKIDLKEDFSNISATAGAHKTNSSLKQLTNFHLRPHHFLATAAAHAQQRFVYDVIRRHETDGALPTDLGCVAVNEAEAEVTQRSEGHRVEN